MYYDQSQNSHFHPRWEFKFPDPGQGHSASSRTLEHPPNVHAVSNPHLVGSRGEFSTRHMSRFGSDEISYTDEANSKISNRLRRRCFNCKAIETSTWRRSVLSPGKLVGHHDCVIERGIYFIYSQLCNKCGLFERTHAIPRPKKFPRRRTHGSKAIRPPTTHPDMRTSFVNRHSKDSEPSSLPSTQLLRALYGYRASPGASRPRSILPVTLFIRSRSSGLMWRRCTCTFQGYVILHLNFLSGVL
jgi:hypothetical protein